ncbi:MAG: DUF2249 domain-containing protein [Bradyrhizobium sp.]|nr:DUF2249 domain-containing protein [Bradyrhizobium sp.]
MVTCARPEDDSRTWRTADAVHIDVRGLEAPEPMIAILRAIDAGEVDTALIAHLDREPIFLYPELDDRGWAYELLDSSCGSSDCEDGVMLRMVRWGS